MLCCQSCLHTDHRALLINCNASNNAPTPLLGAKSPSTICVNITLMLLRENLVNMIGVVFWKVLMLTWLTRDSFITQTLISLHIPHHSITIPENTPKYIIPEYIIPLIKSLLRKRNKLMRKGKVTDAHSFSIKIGKLVTETRSNQLPNVNHEDVKSWSSVRYLTGFLNTVL